jgi:hypothetical protein
MIHHKDDEGDPMDGLNPGSQLQVRLPNTLLWLYFQHDGRPYSRNPCDYSIMVGNALYQTGLACALW